MADAPTDAPATGTSNPPVAPTAPDSPATGEDEPLAQGGRKALTAERARVKELQDRLKELEPLAESARKREEAEKTETQKLNDALAGERDARTKAETLLLRYTVGSDKKVPAGLIPFLTGTTKEEIEQAADALLAELGDRPQMPGRPAERMTDGRPSTSGLEGKDPMALIAMGRGQDTSKH